MKLIKIILISAFIVTSYLHVHVVALKSVCHRELLDADRLHTLPVNLHDKKYTAAYNSGLPPLDIRTWDQASMLEIVPHIFPHNSFGTADYEIDNSAIIQAMCIAFQNSGKNHITLARIVIDCENGSRFLYPIPYVFVSGRSGSTAIAEWSRINGLLKTAIDVRTGLTTITPIEALTKGIGDYGYNAQGTCYQQFAHSERAVILCLLYDAKNSLEHAVKLVVGDSSTAVIREITIQMKVLHFGGVCSSCNTFLGKNASYVSRIQMPNVFDASEKIIRDSESPYISFTGTMDGRRNYLMDIHSWLAVKSGLPIGENKLKIRVSHQPAEVEF